MPELAQVKATIPKDLKRKAFATFALHDEKFNRWLERELRAFIQESDPGAILELYARDRALGDTLRSPGNACHGENATPVRDPRDP
jgi:hypothetical protein